MPCTCTHKYSTSRYPYIAANNSLQHVSNTLMYTCSTSLKIRLQHITGTAILLACWFRSTLCTRLQSSGGMSYSTNVVNHSHTPPEASLTICPANNSCHVILVYLYPLSLRGDVNEIIKAATTSGLQRTALLSR